MLNNDFARYSCLVVVCHLITKTFTTRFAGYSTNSTAQGVDYLLTQNFKHINNATTRTLIAKTVEAYGFTCPLLCSPEELGAVT